MRCLGAEDSAGTLQRFASGLVGFVLLRAGLSTDQAEDFAGAGVDVCGAVFVFSDAEVEDVHRAVGAEFDVDGAFECFGVVVDFGGGAVLGVIDEVLHFAGVYVDADDFVADRADEFAIGRGEGGLIAGEGDDGGAAVFCEWAGGADEIHFGCAGERLKNAAHESGAVGAE